MSGARKINSRSYKISVGGRTIVGSTVTLTINNEQTVAMRNGRPSGVLDGAITAEGQIVLYYDDFRHIQAFAETKGGFDNMDPVDILCYAKIGDVESEIKILCCHLKLTEVLNVDRSSSDESTITVDFVVCDEQIATINGVPVAKKEENS